MNHTLVPIVDNLSVKRRWQISSNIMIWDVEVQYIISFVKKYNAWKKIYSLIFNF